MRGTRPFLRPGGWRLVRRAGCSVWMDGWAGDSGIVMGWDAARADGDHHGGGGFGGLLVNFKIQDGD
jgi:hypothetical protein